MPAGFYGPDAPCLPAAYDNEVYSARERTCCTGYPQTGYSVCGVIRDKYEAPGSPSGPLGYPISNELTNADNVGEHLAAQATDRSPTSGPPPGGAPVGHLVDLTAATPASPP